jgi:hypothetical protein
MNRATAILLIGLAFAACRHNSAGLKREPAARIGDKILYSDEIPVRLTKGTSGEDSIAAATNYINQWAKHELLLQRAEENLTPKVKEDIERQIDENRFNLVVYEYQQQMMLEKMDTVISEKELQDYYSAHENLFTLTSNIVKALFIKLPAETPSMNKFRTLLRSSRQKDMQELESLCYQFAEKYDDFDEGWVTLDRISIELNKDIGDQENFLRRTNYYESSDSSSVYLLGIGDYRLRGSLAPFEFVREDIKRIIWNDRRIAFLKDLENGIYNDAIKEDRIKIY